MKLLKPKILSILAGLIFIITAQTVYSQSIRIKQPNGGENWGQNYTEYIIWESTNIPSTERLRLNLLKDGMILGTIADGLTMEHSFLKWTVGSYQGGIAPPGTGYQIYITTGITPDITPVTPGQIGPNVYQDISDATFTIQAPSIRITAPNGGETWAKDSIKRIKWVAQGIPPRINIRLDLLKDGKILGAITNEFPLEGVLDWKVGEYKGGKALEGSGYTIRIATTSGPPLQDTSDGPFTIQSPYIRIVAPNGGESWAQNSTQEIKWDTTGLPFSSQIGNLKLDLLKDGILLGTIADKIFPYSPTSSYSWLVGSYRGGTAPLGGGYTIKVSTASGLQDMSDGPFAIILTGTIQPKVVTLYTPILIDLCKRVNCSGPASAPPQPFKMSDAKARQYLAIRQEAIQLNNKSKNATPAEKEKIEKRAQELLQQLKKLESSK